MNYPFTAIIGLELAKKSLIYHAIDPKLGGTLLVGHRGCAKSTLARAYAELLPVSHQKLAPFVEIPLGTTEDRLLGSVDASKLVQNNSWEIRQGLIEEAHGGVLYIDEINLLPDHLADFILDSAASGFYRMERDGFSKTVESRYILMGSMNPDEGDLRPQLSDRFAHGIIVTDDFTEEERVEIVKRRLAFEDNPEKFILAHEDPLHQLRISILNARQKLTEIMIPDEVRHSVAKQAKMLQLEGMRPELAVLRTARCAASWNNHETVTQADIDEAWILCLGHRVHQNPPAPTKPSSPSIPPSASSPSSQPLAQNPSNVDSKPQIQKEFFPQHQSDIGNWIEDCHSSSESRSKKYFISQAHGLRISWIESLKVSIKNPNQSRIWNLRYHHTPTRRSLMVFLDASRSTGVNSFLSSVRDLLGGATRSGHSLKHSLLLLQENQLKWTIRQSGLQKFQHSLQTIREASGKSRLISGLKLFYRQVLRKGLGHHDRLILCSDGLASLESNLNAQQTQKQLRYLLERLTRLSVPILWLHPSMPHGLKNWIPKLCTGLPIQLREVEVKK